MASVHYSGVINFEYPALVAHRDEDVAVILGVNHCIRMRPVWKIHWITVDIEVVERIPYPNGLQVCIKVDDNIAQ